MVGCLTIRVGWCDEEDFASAVRAGRQLADLERAAEAGHDDLDTLLLRTAVDLHLAEQVPTAVDVRAGELVGDGRLDAGAIGDDANDGVLSRHDDS